MGKFDTLTYEHPMYLPVGNSNAHLSKQSWRYDSGRQEIKRLALRGSTVGTLSRQASADSLWMRGYRVAFLAMKFTSGRTCICHD